MSTYKELRRAYKPRLNGLSELGGAYKPHLNGLSNLGELTNLNL